MPGITRTIQENNFTQTYKDAHSYTLGITHAHTIAKSKYVLPETKTYLAAKQNIS